MIEIIKTCISLTIELTFLSAIKKREIRVATKTLKFCKKKTADYLKLQTS